MNVPRFRPAIGLLASAFVSLVICPASSAGELNLKTQRVVVFKDGYGLFIKTATARTDEEGHLYCDQVPDEAILGSVWADSDDARLKLLRSRWVDATEKSSSSHL